MATSLVTSSVPSWRVSHVSAGHGGGSRTRPDTELREDVLEMFLHRAAAGVKNRRDLPIRLVFRDPVENLGLTRGPGALV